MLPSELLNPNRAPSRERTHNTCNSQLMQKASKFDYVAEKGSYVRNYALKVSCSFAKNYQWRLNNYGKTLDGI
jgi:hypothetical protein